MYREEHAKALELTKQVSERVIYSENPYSFNTFLRHPQWGKGQFTIRTRAGEDGTQFMWRITGMLKKAGEQGWQPEIPQAPTQSVPSGSHVTTAPLAPPPVTGTASNASSANGGQSFEARTLSATVDSGKAYWKVKGGHFEKFGVTIYEEVLQAAGFANLDPLKTYDLHGYTARFALKDDGKPSKVIQLVKAA